MRRGIVATTFYTDIRRAAAARVARALRPALARGLLRQHRVVANFVHFFEQSEHRFLRICARLLHTDAAHVPPLCACGSSSGRHHCAYTNGAAGAASESHKRSPSRGFYASAAPAAPRPFHVRLPASVKSRGGAACG